jgi:hypothetical protein
MPISILATRCRYCGEKVGRPRKEEEKLTIEDLGGEQHTTYTISGNVREALEAYRAEMLDRTDPLPLHDVPKATREIPAHQRTGIPEIDEGHSQLSALLDSTPSRKPKKPKPTQNAILGRRIGISVAVLIALVAGYFVVQFTWTQTNNYLEQRRLASQPVYINKAREILAEGRTLDAMKEAADALAFTNSPENQAIADEVRQVFIKEINAMLTGATWSQAQMRDAGVLVNRATLIDKHPDLLALMRQVDTEIGDYKLVLRQIDPAGPKATFIIHSPDAASKEQVVGEGDYVADRFLVKKILPTYVRLDDTHVQIAGGYRAVVCRIMTQATPD